MGLQLALEGLAVVADLSWAGSSFQRDAAAFGKVLVPYVVVLIRGLTNRLWNSDRNGRIG